MLPGFPSSVLVDVVNLVFTVCLEYRMAVFPPANQLGGM